MTFSNMATNRLARLQVDGAVQSFSSKKNSQVNNEYQLYPHLKKVIVTCQKRWRKRGRLSQFPDCDIYSVGEFRV